MLNSSIKKIDTPIMGGCINNGIIYLTAEGNKIFVKTNNKLGSDKMFNGEYEGLKAICNTNTIRAPVPYGLGYAEDGQYFIAMEFLEMTSLNLKSSVELGEKLANMHLYNLKSKEHPIKKFGFYVETCCGFLPQDNTWNENWITFFCDCRLEYQIKLLQSKSNKCLKIQKIINDFWPRLKKIIPKFFEDIEIKPSLIHGDLWSGNAAQCASKPVIYDPAVFYGHHEYDIASTTLFGGYSKYFYDAYFKIIPKAQGFDNRMLLYHLFHYLNHWNHFGEGYDISTINTFEELLKLY
ncbi:fructosamine-3-kinase-like [Daktulosphaira vitifoliae]|uniref:fructosamine-3-kinase-like n=1 Tax=Daktulosphaira vitifoliae TaxID=58002 RepID=UPI0021AADCEF|nr:fructosamine-3-kinase-like [Daktulosphaira vitifoliae]